MSKTNFDTLNPEQLIYAHEFLTITVLGGVKLEGLDRMRVTLKVELNKSARPAVRHNLDLYNDTQLEKFIRKIAERHEIGTSVVAGSLSDLTENLESYRLEKIKEQENEGLKSKQLTAAERKEAEIFLQSPNLLERTNELIGKSGVIGEVDNRLIMFLIFTSRKRTQPLHVVSLGASGTGKTHLQEKVGELIPEEDRIELTTLSENAFYYFERRALANKLILIEDLDGAEGALYPLRELQSKRKISKTISYKNTKGDTTTKHLIVEGPVSVAGCTTKEHIYEDNANRSFLLYLDESPEQDSKIMEYQRRASSGSVNTLEEEQSAELLRNVQRLLVPVKVVNPYAELLQLPSEVFKPRRTNAHYLQFIEVVTFYHQYQREQKADEQTGEIFIETIIEDIEAANTLLREIILRKSDELTGACRNYFEKLKLYLLGSDEKTFTNTSMSRLLRIPITTIKRYHLDLVNCGYLKASKKNGSKAYHYEVVSYEEYKELQSRINTALDEALNRIKESLALSEAGGKKNLKQVQQPKSPKQPSKGSGLKKTTPVKEKSE